MTTTDKVRQELLRRAQERALRLSRKVQGEDEQAEPEKPKGLPGKPLPPIHHKDPLELCTRESLARTVAHWREVMPPRFKGLLDATPRPLEEEPGEAEEETLAAEAAEENHA